MVKTHRDLKIWQKSMDLVTKVYKEVENFPDYEKFGLTSPDKKKLCFNTHQYCGRLWQKIKKEFRRFLNISMGSLFEVQTELELSYNLEFLDKETFEKLYEDTREIERMMSSFISTL